MTITVSVADAAATRTLRLAILREDLPPDATHPAPGDAEDAIHLAARDGDRVVGAAVLLPRPFPARPTVANVLQLRGMAVSGGHQGRGIGALVLTGALGIARSRGDEILWCNARSTARGFYEQLGLQVEGQEFLSTETGIPHVVMWRTVAGAPTR